MTDYPNPYDVFVTTTDYDNWGEYATHQKVLAYFPDGESTCVATFEDGPNRHARERAQDAAANMRHAMDCYAKAYLRAWCANNTGMTPEQLATKP